MGEQVVSDADVADGWFDAHCKCGNHGADHPGELCPDRGDTAGILTAEQKASYDQSHAQDMADAAAAVEAAQATLAAMRAADAPAVITAAEAPAQEA